MMLVVQIPQACTPRLTVTMDEKPLKVTKSRSSGEAIVPMCLKVTLAAVKALALVSNLRIPRTLLHTFIRGY